MRIFEYVDRITETSFDLPKRSTVCSAGYDFFNPERVTIEPGQIEYIKTGVKAQMYRNEFLMLANRSSNAKNKSIVLVNGVGIVDADYYGNGDNDGEIAFAFMNISDKPVVFEKGEKLGQGIFFEYLTTEDDAAYGERKGGFGSTGK